ncbi:MAG TPA: hypothetical protein VI796_04730, partial [Candidatus Thermoplasmatota archaeon]|nr:hypothetical protein [Candidatus Thermoplasmatota archaeon]
NAHDAEADARAMIEVLRHQRAKHADRLPTRLEELLEPVREPLDRQGRFYFDHLGTVRFGFGRHRDRPVNEEPRYLAWAATSFGDEEVRTWARRLLTASTSTLKP